MDNAINDHSDCCKVCKIFFKNEFELHKHLRTHKLTIEQYYYFYYPRKDLLTGSFIDFKNKSFYFEHDFNTKTNMLSWLKRQPDEERKRYCKELLLKRKEKKNLIYSPCQVELRTVMSPSVIFYRVIFGDYYELCKNMGLKNKYRNYKKEEIVKVLSVNYDGTILIDTREQRRFKFKCHTEVKKLDFGDYCLEGKPNLVIERKALKDFIGTLTKEYQRFIREVEKAEKNGSKLLVIVEQSLNDALSFPFLPYLNVNWRITPEYLFHNVRELIQKFPNIQFLFTKNRTMAAELTEKILLVGDELFNYDLQEMYDDRILV